MGKEKRESQKKDTKDKKAKQPKVSVFLRALDKIEIIGNRLPHPATLFAIFVLLIMVISEIVTRSSVTAVHPGTGETIRVLVC